MLIFIGASNYFKVLLEDDKQLDSIELPCTIDFSCSDIELLMNSIYGLNSSPIYGELIHDYQRQPKYKVGDIVHYKNDYNNS